MIDGTTIQEQIKELRWQRDEIIRSARKHFAEKIAALQELIPKRVKRGKRRKV